MKKLTLGILMAFALLVYSPAESKAATETKTETAGTTVTATSAETNAMVVRLNEIKAIDMTTLSKSEKKELRKEVRGIKTDLKARGETSYIEGTHGGVYVSVGAAILIVLLLILLL